MIKVGDQVVVRFTNEKMRQHVLDGKTGIVIAMENDPEYECRLCAVEFEQCHRGTFTCDLPHTWSGRRSAPLRGYRFWVKDVQQINKSQQKVDI